MILIQIIEQSRAVKGAWCLAGEQTAFKTVAIEHTFKCPYVKV